MSTILNPESFVTYSKKYHQYNGGTNRAIRAGIEDYMGYLEQKTRIKLIVNIHTRHEETEQRMTESKVKIFDHESEAEAYLHQLNHDKYIEDYDLLFCGYVLKEVIEGQKPEKEDEE